MDIDTKDLFKEMNDVLDWLKLGSSLDQYHSLKNLEISYEHVVTKKFWLVKSKKDIKVIKILIDETEYVSELILGVEKIENILKSKVDYDELRINYI